MVKNDRIGIIGLGLIGGSIAKALKSGKKDYIISAWDRDKKALEAAFSDRVIDRRIEDLSQFTDCDVVFLCIPINAMIPVINDIRNNLPKDCILTDVGSTKGEVVALIKEISLDQTFIGGHPLAGSEKSGYCASKANLFENAYYCITPDETTRPEAVEILKRIIRDMGAIPIKLDAQTHDRVTAAISHVPHVIASSLVNLLSELDGPDNVMKTIAAGGFKDITRIASSSPELWAGICLSNKDMIIETITALEKILQEFKEDLSTGRKERLNTFFETARKLRSSLSDRKSLIQNTYDILVDVEDKPGIIAVIATALAKENINIKNIGILNNRENEEGALEIQFENEESRSRGLAALSALGYKAKVK